MLIYLRLMVMLASLAMIPGCSKLTKENYRKIKMGTDYSQVVKILGKPDNCSEALFIRNCTWGDEQRNITVNFMGDKVVLFSSKNIK